MKLVIFLGALLCLFSVLMYKEYKRKQAKNKKSSETTEQTAIHSPKPFEVASHWHELVKECEENLSPEHRGLVKLIFEKENPDNPAAIQIGGVRISIKRNNEPVFLHLANNPYEALYIARDGYHGTARYIPVPEEVEFILANQTAINTYLKALGLATLSNKDHYWCIDTVTGWDTGWKRFDWNVCTVMNRLGNKFRVKTPSTLQTDPPHGVAYLFVLLKGWDHLFVEL